MGTTGIAAGIDLLAPPDEVTGYSWQWSGDATVVGTYDGGFGKNSWKRAWVEIGIDGEPLRLESTTAHTLGDVREGDMLHLDLKCGATRSDEGYAPTACSLAT